VTAWDRLKRFKPVSARYPRLVAYQIGDLLGEPRMGIIEVAPNREVFIIIEGDLRKQMSSIVDTVLNYADSR
jgi:hypothetical protein